MKKFKKYLCWFIVICVIIEMLCFPSIDNALICLLALIVTFEFCIVVNEDVFLKHTFSFWAYFTLFAYRFFPIFGTLLDGNPVTIGFINAFDVFMAETITFSIATLAFYFCSKRNSNTFLTRLYYKLGWFNKLSIQSYWILGFIGLFLGLGSKFVQNPELSKIISTISVFRYSPICLLFPSLTGIKIESKRKIIWYICLLLGISFTSGSRQVLLYPICTYILLYILDCGLSHRTIFSSYSTPKKIFLFTILLLGPLVFERVSLAMLASRSVVFDKSKSAMDVVSATIENFQDGEKLKSVSDEMFAIVDKNANKDVTQWEEKYVSNSFLNRYCNLKLTDQTFYRLKYVGLHNGKMYENFITNNTILIFPSPILHLFGINIEKEMYDYSPGDLLFSLSSGSSIYSSHVVTSHVADGLATFGYIYFPIQFFIWLLLFCMIDSFILKKGGTVSFSLYGLVSIFTFFGLTRAASGCGSELYYCLRLYWNGIFGIFLAFGLLKVCQSFLKR